MTDILFKINSASRKDIFDHLSLCNSDFIPSLNTRVDLIDFSNKIRDNAITFEAWQVDKLVGVVAAYFNDSVYFKAYITSVSVYKPFFGKGIAVKLVGLCVDYANKNKFIYISLEVNKLNQFAISLYNKFGFIILEESDTSFIMQLDLNPNNNKK